MRRLFLWDVHTKKFRFSNKDITLQFCEFNQDSFGLGVEAYHTTRALVRGKRHFQLGIRLLWAQFWLFIDWRDFEFEAAMRRAREKLLTPDEVRATF